MKRILVITISLAVLVFDTLRHAFYWTVGKKAPATVVILAYHSVAREKRNSFARQMDQLLRCAKPCRADGRFGQLGGERCVAVTFDDGYQTLLDNAIPELQQRGIPATIFVVPGALGSAPNWKDYSDGTDCAMAELLLTVEQLQKLPHDLIEIGSHTMRHPMLPHLREDEVRSELSLSRVTLEEMVGSEVKLFSFPYGVFNPDLIALCRDAGYERVFITHPDSSVPSADEFVMGRIKADPEDSRLEFFLKLRGAYRWRNKWHFGASPKPSHSAMPARDHVEVAE